MYCVRCRAPRAPAGEMADYQPLTETQGNLIGMCPACEAMMYRRVSLARMEQVRGKLDITLPQALPHIGVARARDIVGKRDLPVATIRRMKSFFARHEVDKQGQGFSPGEQGYPSAGRIAWALWGGDPGRSWANRYADDADQ